MLSWPPTQAKSRTLSMSSAAHALDTCIHPHPTSWDPLRHHRRCNLEGERKPGVAASGKTWTNIVLDREKRISPENSIKCGTMERKRLLDASISQIAPRTYPTLFRSDLADSKGSAWPLCGSQCPMPPPVSTAAGCFSIDCCKPCRLN